RFVDPIVRAREQGHAVVHSYAAGSSGPAEAALVMGKTTAHVATTKKVADHAGESLHPRLIQQTGRTGAANDNDSKPNQETHSSTDPLSSLKHGQERPHDQLRLPVERAQHRTTRGKGHR